MQIHCSIYLKILDDSNEVQAKYWVCLTPYSLLVVELGLEPRSHHSKLIFFSFLLLLFNLIYFLIW